MATPRPDLIEEVERKNGARLRANSMPLPGSLKSAFGEKVIYVRDIEIRPLVAYDYEILQAIGSPLCPGITGETTEVVMTKEDAYVLAYQFTRTAKECRQVLKHGPEAFKEAALDDIACTYDADTIEQIMSAITEQIKRATETKTAYAEPASDPGPEGRVEVERRPFEAAQTMPRTG